MEGNVEAGSLVGAAFRAASAAERVAHPEYRVDLDAAPQRLPSGRERERRTGRQLVRAAAARFYRLGLPVVRPVAYRWRSYTSEPVLAELAALRYELAVLRTRSGGGAASAMSQKLMNLQRSVIRELPEAVWSSGGRPMPHFAAAVDAVTAADQDVSAVVPLQGFESVARDLMNWVESVNHPGATVEIVLRFPAEAESSDD